MSKRAFAIRPLREGDADRLRAVMVAAKSHWGYEPQWVHDWAHKPGNFMTEEEEGAEIAVAEVDEAITGWAQWMPRDGVAWLEDLWIEPESMGTGLGRALFEWYRRRAEELGFGRLEWEAEPNAIGFYQRMGARYLREGHRVELGQTLPIMGIDLLD